MHKANFQMSPANHNSNTASPNGSKPTKAKTPVSELSPINELLSNATLNAKRLTVVPGKVMFDHQTEARNLYFLHRGQIRLQTVDKISGAIRLINILGSNDWFGEAALEKKPTYNEEAIVVVSSVITEVSAERLLPILANHPKAMHELIRHLAGKVATARNDASSMVFDDCYARLLKTLIRFSNSSAAMTADGTTVLRITHLQLSQCVGVARETISLALTQLRHKHIIRTGRNQLSFKVDSLRTFLRDYEKTLKTVNPEEEELIDE